MERDLFGAAQEARRQIDERVAGTVTSARALFAMVSAARRVQDRYNDALASHDLSLSQYQILDFLRRMGPNGAPPEAFHGGMRDMCVLPTCESHVERKGWLTRDQVGTRFITEPGRQLLAEVAPVLEELADGMTSMLGTNELGTLVGLAARLDPEAS